MRRAGALVLALGLAVAGLPAAAQGLCGGVGDTGRWIGGTEETSDIAGSAAHLEQMALLLMGQEHVGLFRVSTQADVRIEAQGRGAGDPMIDLRNEAGDILMSDDDSGGNGASRMELPLAPGTYCVSLRSYDSGPMTGVIRVGLYTHEPLTEGVAEPSLPTDDMSGCDLTAAVALAEGPVDEMLAEGVSLTGTVTDAPYLSFQIAGERMLTITAENEAADPMIAIYDEFGNWIAENDDTNGRNARIDLSTPLYTGTYCIAVTALADSTQPITVTVTDYDEVAGQIGMFVRGEAAPPLDGSYPVTALGPLESRVRSDIRTDARTTWFSVEVEQAGLIVTEAVTNDRGDPVLVMFDDMGQQVARNDDSNGTLDSMIAVRVLPGTYLIGVRQVGDGVAVPTRMLFARYLFAQ